MQNVKIGLIPAPELPTEIAEKLLNTLPDQFNHFIDSSVSFEIALNIDPMTGAAENVEEILYKASDLKEKKGWDYAICLTDLPIFTEGYVVAADVSVKHGVGQISIPAFGSMPIKRRLKKAIVQLFGELYFQSSTSGESTSGMAQGAIRPNRNQTAFRLLKKQFPISPVRRIEHKGDSEIDIRFIVVPRINGRSRILIGMAHANRPWGIMPSFKKVIALAFATGAFGLIFPTLWQLSNLFTNFRLITLTVIAITGMVVWIVLAHNLWEKPAYRNKPKIRKLYNNATLITLVAAVMMYYVMLFTLFFVAVVIFIPPGFFKEMAFLNEPAGVLDYLRLSWLSTSISTIAGAIGAGLENEELVRNITYGYRQKRRYQEVQQYD
ncbi:5,10-methylene-tetrahydrofolate dehydrogenase [Pontibacillus yanchengensis]|uniref:5,10-methylene-tetrahydrofolate dehydrogenase n=2 Tax=Pontibacillus yanchengensis TaxID=462910 RepID=A0ACC7VDI6_9BACI|nr:5,10-methylene-tetrahydrofolate dehydrogenase [Pontibacillus yanchengensis]MYL34738.1 5,10-methylene-tetrahydrofolate dehydrogenase [Pontibacillus yanchengensis]MYL52276.1 5,10-methylene-tetrahydrofolate dehydrogenase [Pontibacillus yanchengensis]